MIMAKIYVDYDTYFKTLILQGSMVQISIKTKFFDIIYMLNCQKGTLFLISYKNSIEVHSVKIKRFKTTTVRM